MHLHENRKRIQERKLFGGIVIFIVVIAFFAWIFASFTQRNDARETSLVESAIRRAVITCYAIEGKYPQNLAYLCDNYGVIVDENQYYVRYEAFASNIMPTISVLRKGRVP